MIVGIVVMALALFFFRRIDNPRRFQLLMGSVPICLILLVHLLLNTPENTASYFWTLRFGPSWIKLHFAAFVLALAAATFVCRTVARKYAGELSTRKRKQKSSS